MLDYEEQVKAFLKENFEPSEPNKSNFNKTTRELLGFLFETFPNGCISDYQLNEILLELGHQRHNYVSESIVEIQNKKEKHFEIRKQLASGWCLRSEFNLETEIIENRS